MSTDAPSTALASLTFVGGPLKGRTIQITQAITNIGRESSNEIVVKGDAHVSRQHARLVWANGVWQVENISEHNWITVNKQQVQQAVIQDQAVIALGDRTSFIFNIGQPAAGSQPAQPMPAAQPGVRKSPQKDELEGPTDRVPPPPSAAAGAPAQPPPARPQPARPTPSQPPAGAAPVQLPPAPRPAPSQPPAGSMPVQPPPATWPLAQPGPAAPMAPGGFSGGSFPMAAAQHTMQVAHPAQTLIAEAARVGVPVLEVSDNTTGQRRRYPLDQKVLNIGRDPTNEVIINEPCVSGQHLQLVRDGQQLTLIHPHPARTRTTNGLLYQGRKIRGDEAYRRVLAPGDVFRIGDESGTLVTLTYRDESAVQQEVLPEVRPIKLEVADLTIGRKPNNTVVLPHPLVSGHHARLVREGGTYRIYDLHSTNHVYVNSELVTSHLLKMGDEIRIGPYRLIYESTQLTQYDESSSIRLDAINLRKVGTRGVTLLNNISLSIPPRAFVALVGGSGAGKSTLMDALSGLRPAEDGKVLYNGQDYYQNLGAFNTQIGYVPQDDIVHRDLTVERALYYAAKMRLPSDFTMEQIWQRISEVLDDVELTERRHLLIKKLSGGQRKRVSIALELLANPSLFFLDEPTSGLDPGLDRKMMVLLRKLADKGHTIILVTHATNNISVCDYVCFLARGGRLAYFGPPDGAKTYFGRSDFAEIYSTLEATDEQPNAPEESEARYKLSQEYQQYVTQPLRAGQQAPRAPGQAKERKRIKRGGSWMQFRLLFQRRLELLRNDLATLLVLLLQAPLVALLLMGLIKLESNTNGSTFLLDNIIRCQSQIRLTPAQAGSLGNTTGVLVVPATLQQIDQNDNTVNCDLVQSFLQHDPQGQQYSRMVGGTNQALQKFEVAANNGNAQRLVFMLVLIPIMFGTITGTREIIKEIAIYKRERAVNLRIPPYLVSKILVFSVISLVQAAEVVIVVEAFEPFQQGVFLPAILEAYITLALSGIGGLMWGFLISAFSPNEDTATSLISAVIVPPVIFSGVIVSMKDYFSQVVALIFPLRWGMAALGSSVGLHSNTLGDDKFFGNDLLYHPDVYSIYTKADATNRIVVSWIALGVLILAVTFIIGYGLKRKDVRR
jgi:ABC-type multidrug transport system ATPase subunit/pSer/pThr/pTyr-binding forkhead associated (FHA) protein